MKKFDKNAKSKNEETKAVESIDIVINRDVFFTGKLNIANPRSPEVKKLFPYSFNNIFLISTENLDNICYSYNGVATVKIVTDKKYFGKESKLNTTENIQVRTIISDKKYVYVDAGQIITNTSQPVNAYMEILPQKR